MHLPEEGGEVSLIMADGPVISEWCVVGVAHLKSIWMPVNVPNGGISVSSVFDRSYSF